MPSFALETLLEAQYVNGPCYIAGLDEVGTGAIAGPIVCAAVVLARAKLEFYDQLNDSKRVSPGRRKQLYHTINERATAVGIAVIEVQVIEQQGVKGAVAAGFRSSLKQVREKLPDRQVLALIDGANNRFLTKEFGVSSYVDKADSLSYSVAAASIVAKHHRDNLMYHLQQSLEFDYGWASNVGYGVPEHLEALRKYGVTKHHRKHFKPVKLIIKGGDRRSRT